MYNVFTVDLEDWFYSAEFQSKAGVGSIGIHRDNLVNNTRRILKLLRETGISACFFILGKLAENEPCLIEEIAGEGHEIACHGYNHKTINQMTPDEFRRDLDVSIAALRAATGDTPKGYRAPRFSVNLETVWALDILKEYDFIFDSSIQPIRVHPEYGMKKTAMEPFLHKSGIIELPMSCAQLMKIRIPCSGGGYFRHYPYSVFKYLLKRCNKQNRPGIFYIHPWELDRLDGLCTVLEVKGLTKYRKYHNIDKTLDRLGKLVKEFEFIPVFDLITKLNLYHER